MTVTLAAPVIMGPIMQQNYFLAFGVGDGATDPASIAAAMASISVDMISALGAWRPIPL